MRKNRLKVEKGHEEEMQRFIRERGWYVPALHERYIEMRKGDEKHGG